ncbi:hypothetical protein Y032_0102g3439 [Ancylostoma ceylanicum]|uniref:Uncharacterized protein n=1 Tax=Ancylostoma ceylanicum TaxID=53326 RepID=A0A016THB4_9BILA|nr:hypothetical protein Y032_0102g3439 [Ancylostoma ceylanicum]
MPEDGDFGTEFIDTTDTDNNTVLKKKPTEEQLPEIEFSVDGKNNEDYYEQVSEIIDETTPSTTTSTTTASTAAPVLPEISLSIDEDGEELEEVAVAVPPPSTKTAVPMPSPSAKVQIRDQFLIDEGLTFRT